MGVGRDPSGLRKDGSGFPVAVGINPVETGEGPKVLSVILDLSERKQSERRIQDALQRMDMLGDNQNRIRSIPMIHQPLHQSEDFAQLEFDRFLGGLLPRLMESHSATAGHVSIRVNADGVKLPINEAIPCGLIVNELVSNALKHGFARGRRGSIELSITQHDEQGIEMTVHSDGHAIPEELDLEHTGSLGLQRVQLLTQPLHGELITQRGNSTGFTLRFQLGNSP